VKDHQIIVRHKASSSNYVVDVTSGSLRRVGEWANECLGGRLRKAVIVSNLTVFDLYGESVRRSLVKAGSEVSVWLMKDGERHKNIRSLEAAVKHFSQQRLTRDDVIIALGGGVVGDLAGFAAAVHLRGIRFLQVPTTLLSMIDSSVGGKTGVNTEFGKNLVGSFHRPAGVLIDVETLNTLPRRELTAGLCEAVKQGALSGRKLFEETKAYLADLEPSRTNIDIEGSVRMIAHQIAFKASIVEQDETEKTGRLDARSRKILNFGHTFGHALEKVTNYRRLKHGEAVGYGMMLAGELSKNLDLFTQNELKSLNDVVHLAGTLPPVDDIDPESIFEAFKFDKKSTGDSLNWVLLKGIGKPVILPEKDIPRSVLTRAVKTILKR
jgi:3-dehydroquinate synthase